MKKNYLDTPRAAVLVAFYFPPLNVIAAQRSLRMARVLLRKYEMVYVVTFSKQLLDPRFTEEEFGLDIFNEPRLQVIYLNAVLTTYGLTNGKNSLFMRALSLVLTRTLCSSGLDLVYPLYKTLIRLVRTINVRLLLISGGPFLPMWAASQVFLRTKVPLVLDYRDLWSRNPQIETPVIFRSMVGRFLESRINSRCSKILTVSEGCRKSLQKSKNCQDIEVLFNYPDSEYVKWFDSIPYETQREKIFDKSKLNIVFTGTIYPGCTAKVLLKAMQALSKSEIDMVRVIYCGESSKVIHEEFSLAGMQKNFIDLGFVKKRVALSAVKGADILLSLMDDRPHKESLDEVRGLVTTKVFDYLIIGKPIINIGPRFSDLLELVETLHYKNFLNFTGNEAGELCAYLKWAILSLSEVRNDLANVKLPTFEDKFFACIKEFM